MGNFSVTHWIILGIFGLMFFKLIKSFKGKGGAPAFCKTCGHLGESKNHTPGSTLIELVLWLCFIIPGLIYSIWRLTSKKAACAACGSLDLVPPTSPVAIAALKNLNN